MDLVLFETRMVCSAVYSHEGGRVGLALLDRDRFEALSPREADKPAMIITTDFALPAEGTHDFFSMSMGPETEMRSKLN